LYLNAYRQCLKRLENEKGDKPYNFIMTKDWMLLILRREPVFSGIRVNSLGYMGFMLAVNEEKH
jgi:ATP adenylyltransferase